MQGQWLFFRTMAYFITQGLIYGIGVGGLCGTLIVPVLGTWMGGWTGGFVGVALGIITGIVVTVINRYWLHPDVDIPAYRRKLTRYTGFLSLGILGVITLIAVVANAAYNTTEIARWQDTAPQFSLSDFMVNGAGWLVLMLAFVIPVAVSIAYSTSYYADLHVARLIKKKNDDIVPVELPTHPGSSTWVAHSVFAKSGWVVIAGALVGGFSHHYQTIQQDGWALNFGAFAGGAAAGALVVLVVIIILILLNSYVLALAHRLYFDEYVPYLSPESYQKRLMIILGLVTLVYGVIVTGVIFAPLAGILAALSARDYARRHYHSTEKLKRSPVKNEALAAEF